MRFLIALLIALPVCAPAPARAENISRQMATGGCMLFIKQMLHDPDSASFGLSSEAAVVTKGNRAMVIRSVRATNGFGAVRLTEIMCLLELRDGIVTPVFIAPKGERSAEARAILKKWALLESPKAVAKK